MIRSPKEHCKHLDVSLFRAWTKPSHRTIQSQMAKAMQQIDVSFSAEWSGGQSFGGSDDRVYAYLGVPIGFSRQIAKTAVEMNEYFGDQQQIADHIFSEDHRLESFTHLHCSAKLARN